MIPPTLNDGFTVEVVPDAVFCRPMLEADRQALSPLLRHTSDKHTGSRKVWAQVQSKNVYVLSGPSVTDMDLALTILKIVLSTAGEAQDFQDLADSVSLHISNSGLSVLQCGTCREYCVDHEKGEVYIGAEGKPVPLPPGVPVPCLTQWGCAKRHFDSPLGLSNPRWAATWRHYWTYVGMSQHPLSQCPLFIRNRMLLNWIVNYGRDSRFDPFAGGSSGRTAADVPAERVS